MHLHSGMSPIEVIVGMNQEIEELKSRVTYLEKTTLEMATVMEDITSCAKRQNDQFGTLLAIVKRLSDR